MIATTIATRCSGKDLAKFNARWPLVHAGHRKKGTKAIGNVEEFGDELQESEVIEICHSAGIVINDVHKILEGETGSPKLSGPSFDLGHQRVTGGRIH